MKLARVLAGAPFLTEEEKACFRFPDQGFADYYGEGMGIGFEDGLSGRLTLAGGMARAERGRFIQNFNIRYPVTADAEALVRQMSEEAGTYGWILAWSRDNPPCVITGKPGGKGAYVPVLPGAGDRGRSLLHGRRHLRQEAAKCGRLWAGHPGTEKALSSGPRRRPAGRMRED